VTTKVTAQVSASTAQIGSSTKETWLEPLRGITRDLASDVREAFRPGGASEAHAALRATASETRGATPRNVASTRASADSADAAGASGGFRGGIGWEPTPPEPPSTDERLDTLFASLETREDELDGSASAERLRSPRDWGTPRDANPRDAPGDVAETREEDEETTRERLLRDETFEAFSRLGTLKTTARWGDDEIGLGRAVRAATTNPGAAAACVAILALLAVASFAVRDRSPLSARLVHEEPAGDGPGNLSRGNMLPETPPPPMPP
jgi:hypothetical protein